MLEPLLVKWRSPLCVSLWPAFMNRDFLARAESPRLTWELSSIYGYPTMMSRDIVWSTVSGFKNSTFTETPFPFLLYSRIRAVGSGNSTSLRNRSPKSTVTCLQNRVVTFSCSQVQPTQTLTVWFPSGTLRNRVVVGFTVPTGSLSRTTARFLGYPLMDTFASLPDPWYYLRMYLSKRVQTLVRPQLHSRYSAGLYNPQ